MLMCGLSIVLFYYAKFHSVNETCLSCNDKLIAGVYLVGNDFHMVVKPLSHLYPDTLCCPVVVQEHIAVITSL